MNVKVVVDPNVFISAEISSLGYPARIARAAGEGVFQLMVSDRLLSELHGVLMRPRFRRYLTEGEAEELIANLRKIGTSAEEANIGRVVPGDTEDDYLVALAYSSGADYLVSGDPHLAEVEGEVAVPMLTPRQFGELLERGGL